MAIQKNTVYISQDVFVAWKIIHLPVAVNPKYHPPNVLPVRMTTHQITRDAKSTRILNVSAISPSTIMVNT